MRLINSILAGLPAYLWALNCLAVEDTRKPPQADPWGIAIFVGLLVVALDTDVHIDRGFVQRVGARSELVVMKEAEPGRNLRLLKLPAGRYHWHSLRIGNWQVHSTMLVWPLSGKPEYEFEVRPGVINYFGEIVFRRSDWYDATLYLINHGLRALDRQVLRHDQQHAVAAHRRGHRQCDAGVARGRLDQRVAGLDLAALLGAPDHGQGRPVLDRAGGVVALQLHQQGHVGIGVDAAQAQQRGIANQIFQGGEGHNGIHPLLTVLYLA